MTLKDCVKYLTENSYLVGLNNMPYLTRKFYKDVVDKDIGLSVVERSDVVVKESTPSIPKKNMVILENDTSRDVRTVNWDVLYPQFIREAEIPSLAYSGNSQSYRVNMSTKPGKEAFRAALLEGISYNSLLERARRYYKITQMPVKVENFFKNEIWRNEFNDDGDSLTESRALG